MIVQSYRDGYNRNAICKFGGAERSFLMILLHLYIIFILLMHRGYPSLALRGQCILLSGSFAHVTKWSRQWYASWRPNSTQIRLGEFAGAGGKLMNFRGDGITSGPGLNIKTVFQCIDPPIKIAQKGQCKRLIFKIGIYALRGHNLYVEAAQDSYMKSFIRSNLLMTFYHIVSKVGMPVTMK